MSYMSEAVPVESWIDRRRWDEICSIKCWTSLSGQYSGSAFHFFKTLLKQFCFNKIS